MIYFATSSVKRLQRPAKNSLLKGFCFEFLHVLSFIAIEIRKLKKKTNKIWSNILKETIITNQFYLNSCNTIFLLIAVSLYTSLLVTISGWLLFSWHLVFMLRLSFPINLIFYYMCFCISETLIKMWIYLSC